MNSIKKGGKSFKEIDISKPWGEIFPPQKRISPQKTLFTKPFSPRGKIASLFPSQTLYENKRYISIITLGKLY